MKRLLVIAPVVLVAACGTLVDKSPTSLASEQVMQAYVDQPIEAYRRDLLELAFDGVSKMPLMPHIKNRSRAQQKVVDACIELGQLKLAYTDIEQIENWQRWLGYANLAYDYAQQGELDTATQLLEKIQPALRMSDDRRKGRIVAATPNPLVDTLEDWRYEAVLSRVAEVKMLVKDGGIAKVDADRYGDLNASRINASVALQNADSFQASMLLLDPYLEDPNFEIVHLGLIKMADLFKEYYDQVDLPAFVEKVVEPKTGKMPVFLRIDILDHLAQVALAHDDIDTVDSLTQKMDELVSPLASTPRFQIPEAVKLVRIRYEAGHEDAARSELDALLSGYTEARDRIVNMYRAELLCLMAEEYDHMGDTAKAIDLYSLAVVEGQENPNSRPRADDLNRICCSMAVHGVQPSETLWADLKRMSDALGDPW